MPEVRITASLPPEARHPVPAQDVALIAVGELRPIPPIAQRLAIDLLDAQQKLAEAKRLRPIAEYHEDYGTVMWHHLPISEPPYVGSPLDSDWDEESDAYYTHWQIILQSDTDGSDLLAHAEAERKAARE